MLRITLVLSLFVFLGHYGSSHLRFQEPTQIELVLSENDVETNSVISFEKAIGELALAKYLITSSYTPNFTLLHFNQRLEVKFKTLSKKHLNYNRTPIFFPIKILLPSSDDDIAAPLIG